MGKKPKIYGQFRKCKIIHQNKKLEKKHHLIYLIYAFIFSHRSAMCMWRYPCANIMESQLQFEDPQHCKVMLGVLIGFASITQKALRALFSVNYLAS